MDKIIKITRHFVKNAALVPWVKFLWQLEANDADFHYKLLPTDCIDVILNLASDMVYEVASQRISAPPFHINGLRGGHSFIHQENTVRIFGISFYPYGLYPFVHQSMTALRGSIVDLFQFAPNMAHKLNEIKAIETAEEILSKIEAVLLEELVVDWKYMERAQIIFNFIADTDHTTVQAFCKKRSLNIKTFERMVLHNTGFTPKALHTINCFQAVGNQLAHGAPDSLAGVAYDNRFADQAHFTKEFRRFSGAAPGAFLAEKSSVKENAEYTYL